MYIEVDLATIPPSVELREPDDFTAFKIVLGNAREAYVSPTSLRDLAGERASDPEWEQGLRGMLSYAREHGWVNDAGDVRAHIET